jgi:hypothetical protein
MISMKPIFIKKLRFIKSKATYKVDESVSGDC